MKLFQFFLLKNYNVTICEATIHTSSDSVDSKCENRDPWHASGIQEIHMVPCPHNSYNRS